MISQNLDIKNLILEEKWSLFIDRDGVINTRIIDDYVKTPSEFNFIDGTLEAISIFTKIFYPIVVVTNQQGIGKGLMSIEDLNLIHNKMNSDIIAAGGKIDKVYFCPDLANSGSKNRKPEIGMALQAKVDFPEIDFNKSIIIGDSLSDMKFGKNTGMKTVFIGNEETRLANKDIIDYTFSSLIEFGKELVS
jgi:histidinol-phosphate phosphatase family protein